MVHLTVMHLGELPLHFFKKCQFAHYFVATKDSSIRLCRCKQSHHPWYIATVKHICGAPRHIRNSHLEIFAEVLVPTIERAEKGKQRIEDILMTQGWAKVPESTQVDSGSPKREKEEARTSSQPIPPTPPPPPLLPIQPFPEPEKKITLAGSINRDMLKGAAVVVLVIIVGLSGLGAVAYTIGR